MHFFLNNSYHNNKNVFIISGVIFFVKTNKVKQLRTTQIGGAIKQNSSVVQIIPNTNMSDFWKKFQKLKRPKTEVDYNTYYLDLFKTRLNNYSKAGFLITYNSFYLIRSKSENFIKGFLQLNKQILVSPKYSSSTINKYLSVSNVQDFEFQFLRKNKVYNKGRYSRCRQNYRTGVYMCMYLSVVSIFGLYYWFYKFSFNFTYLWWLFIFFVGSFFLPKIVKYRLYEPTTLFSKVFDIFKWTCLIFSSIFF